MLAASAPSDWRALDPENTIYLELAAGPLDTAPAAHTRDRRVVIELAPAFAPNHAANSKALAREKYFDGLAILRVQDNYVAQWGDPAEDEKKQRPIKTAQRHRFRASIWATSRSAR